MRLVEEPIDGGTRCWIDDGGPLSWDGFARGLAGDVGALLTASVTGSPHRAVFWETVSSTSATRDRPVEWVVRRAGLTDRADPSAFGHRVAGQGMATFENLGGDAVLVVPCVETERACGAHLAAFLRDAPPERARALWAAVGDAVREWWDRRPDRLWVSTSGAGVPWVHVRLDTRPKYYGWGPYRTP